MPTVSFIHAEINPSHSEGSGGGTRSHILTEQNPIPATGSGGGRRTFFEIELVPIPVEGNGGGRRAFALEEIPPVLSLPIPEVTTEPATEIGLVEAAINGFLKDNGGMLCNCGFEWGLTESYGKITPLQSRTAGEYFSQLLTGLEPDTIYHFRAFASNIFGLNHGMDRAFSTLSTMTPPYFQGPLMALLEPEEEI